MEIRPANNTELEEILALYHRLIDWMMTAEYRTGWRKEVYPSTRYVNEAISRGECIVGIAGGKIVAVMVQNHKGNAGHRLVDWPVMAPAAEVLQLHAMGVDPGQIGRGYGKEMLRYAVSTAKEQGCRAIRADVLENNRPAERMCILFGFRYVDTIRMLYEDTGWAKFECFEYSLEDEKK